MSLRRTPPSDARGLVEALGGTRGMIEATIPGVLFAVTYPVSGGRLGLALAVALVAAVVIGAVALWHKHPIGQVVASLLGVGVMAGWAAWRGRPEEFFFPSIVKNIGYASAYALSCLVRWPLMGVLLGPLLGEGMRWRQDRPRYRAYWWASWLWCALFLVRVAVHLPLYLTHHSTILGLANITLGLPLFELACGGTWLILRGTHPEPSPDPADDDEQPAAVGDQSTD